MLPPRADLHRHLDGSLRPETLRALADEIGVAVPAVDALRFRAGMGLADALARFEATLSVLQHPDAVARVAAEICEDAAADGVTTLEIRFAPQLHRAAPIEEIIDAAISGAAGRAGIILCGLWGEPPSVLDALVRAARLRRDVVAIDLAGGPGGHRVSMETYAPAFIRAAELGIGRTVHASEGRPPHEIRVAIEHLRAQRIGHGTTLTDDESILALVVERGITIEACPTSNVHTGAIARTDDHRGPHEASGGFAVDERGAASWGPHPLPRWLRRGVRACVNTDNTLLSDVTSSSEHARAAAIPGMDDELLARAIRCGHEAAFRR